MMGGMSTRMGQDKSRLHVAGKPLYELAAQKLATCCKKIYLSVNARQAHESWDYPVVVDQYPGQGPLGGILSCPKTSDESLLILAVDMPLIEPEHLQVLIEAHHATQMATAYFDRQADRWEGMLSVWEPAALPVLKALFDNGHRSLAACLSRMNAQPVMVQDPKHFLNLNRMEDVTQITW